MSTHSTIYMIIFTRVIFALLHLQKVSPIDKEGKKGENKTELNISLYKVLKVSEWNV